jgi:hypothetical protein
MTFYPSGKPSLLTEGINNAFLHLTQSFQNILGRLTQAFSLLDRAFVHHGHEVVTPAPCRATTIGGGVLGSNESTLGAFTIAVRDGTVEGGCW